MAKLSRKQLRRQLKDADQRRVLAEAERDEANDRAHRLGHELDRLGEIETERDEARYEVQRLTAALRTAHRVKFRPRAGGPATNYHTLWNAWARIRDVVADGLAVERDPR